MVYFKGGEKMAFQNFEFPHTSFYDTDLRELIRMYKELLDTYTSLKETIDGLYEYVENVKSEIDLYVKEATEKALQQIKSEVTSIIIQLNNQLSKILALEKQVNINVQDIATLYAEIDKTNNDINTKIAKVYNDFAEYKDSIDGIIDNKLEYLEEYINEHVTKIDRLYVINPITGLYEDTQTVLNQLAEYTFEGFGLTAQEYDDLNLRVNEYDSQMITALNYSTRGYFVFFKLIQLRMRNPFNGLITSYEDVIYVLAELHKNALTVDEYDNMQLEAKAYDNKNITAYNYDWNGKAAII